MILYHGGHFDDPTHIWPLTHFGTKEAALHRIRQNYEDRNRNKPFQGFLYRCEVGFGSRMIDLPDWHAARTAGVILALHKAGMITQEDSKCYMRPVINAESQKNDILARTLAINFLHHLGISAIRYRNEHEGRDFSYLIFDTSNIHVLDYEEIDASSLPPILPDLDA